MKKIILLGLLLVSFVGYSQIPDGDDSGYGEIVIDGTKQVVDEKEPDKNDPNYIHTAVEIAPEYPKGIEEFRKFIAQNYQSPKVTKDLKGLVFVQFVVEEDGSLSDIKIIRDLGFGAGDEVVRVLKLTGKWNPGIQNGKPVRVRYTLPVQVNVKAKKK
ncbi:MAG: energy transducer TonB [Flavobacteriaceae bacterium]